MANLGYLTLPAKTGHDDSTPTAAPSSMARGRAAVAAMVGTMLEWYDFTLFTLFSALVFQRIFFVSSSPEMATVLSLGIFAAGFIARPLGALLFGRIGDKYGRKIILVASLIMMGAATSLIGLLPTYAQIGGWAALPLLALRLIQGFAAGAELGTAITYSAEYAPPRWRGIWAAAPAVGNFAGIVLSALAFRWAVGLSEEDLFSWGWRIPFISGAAVLILGIVIRAGMHESPAYVAKNAGEIAQHLTLSQALLRAWKPMLILGVVYFCANGSSYFFQALAANYAASVLAISRISIANATLLGAIGGMFTVMMFGALSDKIGRRPVMIVGFLLALIAAAILLYFLKAGDVAGFTAVMFIALALANAGYNSAINSWGSELFTTEVRLTGMSFSREIAGSLGGGLVPVVGASIIAAKGADAGQYLLALLGVIAGIAILTVLLTKETRWAASDMDVGE
ncbi:MHS family shikimate/dehydroshikimate transporter-like MFS transporter [Bradyrhizobium sp. GM5.1]